jgi:DNA polymerase-3 subunit epsilon
MLHLIFDTETTGLPKDWSAPTSDGNNWPRLVQLSVILNNGDSRVEHDFIIKPKGFEIPEQAAAIHGITTERALKEGIDIDLVLSIFHGFIQISDVVVAHNLDFDRKIMGAEFHRIGQGAQFEAILASKKVFCTMKKSSEILELTGTHAGGNKWPKLIELYQKLFNKSFADAHNSLGDARACERCYFELINRNTSAVEKLLNFRKK